MSKHLFQGLCAFPLTPLYDAHIDEARFTALLAKLVDARVDGLGVLGSTGSYAYLTREERARITRLAVENAGDIPVMVSIGALRLDEILHLADDAQRAGASAVMLAPANYQTPTPDEVFSLYERVTRALSVPLCVYENVPATGFTFSDALLAEVARLPGVGAVKLNRLPADKAGFAAEVKARLPATVALGVSGDRQSPAALAAGFDVWYSVLGGLFPHACLAMARAGRSEEALAPLWALFETHGSLRVVAAAAEIMGTVAAPALPFPLQAIGGEDRRALAALLESTHLS